MNRNRFLQGLKSNIQRRSYRPACRKREAADYSEKSSETFLENKMYRSDGGIRRASAAD